MTILSLISVLLASQWQSTCVMSQTMEQQGFTVETVSFENTDSTKNELSVSFTRVWYKDALCSVPKGSTNTSKGTVIFGNPLSENTVEADWNLNGKIQLGALALDPGNSGIRTSTSSFGTSRNTMLSLFPYFAK